MSVKTRRDRRVKIRANPTPSKIRFRQVFSRAKRPRLSGVVSFVSRDFWNRCKQDGLTVIGRLGVKLPEQAKAVQA